MDTTVTSIKRTSWFGTTFWVVIGGLLLLNISFFIEFFNPLTLQQVLFRLDFHYWFPSLALPLWLILTLLVIDAATFQQHRTKTGKWKKRFDILILVIKTGLVFYIAYLFFDILHAPLHRSWRLLWYAANVPLILFFTKKWMYIYQTKKQKDFTPEALNVRKQFLNMSITIASEIGIYDFMLVTGLDRLFSYSLWYWFGFGAYSHWAAAAFVLICLVTGLTLFVFKEWLMAIRQVRKVNDITNNSHQSELTS